MMKLSTSSILAANLLRLRRQRRVSLDEVARAAGVAIGSLSRIESGEANPRLSTLEAVAEALSVPVESLFERLAPRIHVVRAHEMAKRQRRGLTTKSAGHITAGGVDLDLSFRLDLEARLADSERRRSRALAGVERRGPSRLRRRDGNRSTW